MNTTTTTRDRWITERLALMAREKTLMQLHDEVARERRALPRVRIEKDYVFESTAGPRTLAELFAGRRQLIVQHFMFGPGWEEGCRSCSFMADHLDGMRPHLAARDITQVAVSLAPLVELQRFRERMGWQVEWVSSSGNDFNHDFAVSFSAEEIAGGKSTYNYGTTPFRGQEAPGVSVFMKDDDGTVFHTYSTFGRGVEVMMGAYQLIDLVPRGRDEREVAYKMEWLRHHDRYDAAPAG